MKRLFSLIQIALLFNLWGFYLPKALGEPPKKSEARTAQTPNATALGAAIASNRSKVEEFRIIQDAAKELGLRVWLFGGTAAGYAHYVKANLNHPDADYEFSRIYRSTQDADLVVDGTVQDAERLEARIKEKMSYLQGLKDSFEVRLLRKPRILNGVEREPLLNDANFSNQNSDSHSLGLIELTESEEPVVRDLKQWDKKPTVPTFLKDAADGKITFYRNPKHTTTRFYQEGRNPEIFSAKIGRAHV